MIEIKNLTKIYTTPHQQVLALDNVSLTVNKGEIFGIIGLSGAGKSTLIRCINMLEKPTSGTIIVDGEDMTLLSKDELRLARQKIGMIFQHFNLLSSRTVFDNVMFPLEIAKVPRKEAKKRVAELLELVGLKDKARAYPSQLSGGQKQRVGIARALANDPKILLSDEATSALDPETTRSILKLLKDINRQLNITILLITHDMNVIKQICDRVAVIDKARIVEIGDVLTIFSNPATPTSRSFLDSIIKSEVPEDLLHLAQNNKESSRLVRISFIGSSAGEPIISTMIKKFDIKANILYGNIDRVKDIPFGNLILEIMGEPVIIKEALDFLKDNGLEIEVLKNAPSSN
ncbi:D-methionine transport system ATP-binding protein [Thermosyntropha lipolytica DSM 11003]|uniref:D-methionine transport system ATP-binding protein n=1 Tax=Thermosyntropha lipolytica DSM 11003 TaxID=1123382 RepID=A0A1M5QZF9_9FIRM|nr:methionine ABC transporter ATP-binding protein [Thermosyntropha lipolytica]SHH19524.1 D-methionine transport system ATP-binding protein [Thermosyntropha lipolytica DSM 11003]